MLGSIFVPTPSVINNWNTLNTLPIVETAPRSVPLSIFVRYPSESLYDRTISLSVGFPQTDTLILVMQLGQDIQKVERFLAEIYSKRAASTPLFSYLEKVKAEKKLKDYPPEFLSEKGQNIAKSLNKPTIDFLQKIRNETTGIVQNLSALFSNDNIWMTGKYSEALIDHISILIFKLTALEQLLQVKSSIINDVTNFLKLAKDQELSESIMKLRMWITSKNSITHQIRDTGKNIPEKSFKAMFKIISSFLRKKIEDDDFIYPEMQYVYLNMFIFMLQYYKQQQEIEIKKNSDNKKPKYVLKELSDEMKNFIKCIIIKYPILLIFFEYASDTGSAIPESMKTTSHKTSIQETAKYAPPTLDSLLVDLRKYYSKLSNNITRILFHEPNPSEAEELSNCLVATLHIVAASLNSVHEIISKSLAFPPPVPPGMENKQMTKFELSMKYGFKNDLQMILLILSISRSIKEVIISNLPLVQQYINYYVQYYFQNFAYNKLPPAIVRSSKCEELKKILEKIRALIGFFNDNDFPIRPEAKKYGKLTPNVPNCAPHISIVEIVRIQLQNLINPENPLTAKKSVLSSSELASEDRKEIEQFLQNTKSFGDILALSDTIDVIFDQSSMFFKETYLDIEKVNFFPASTSLPIILSEYALENYQKPELTNALFFPLSIYDDAASTALRYLKSKYLYDEIKAEAEICLESITRSIADSAFHPIWKFAAVRSLSKSMSSSLPNNSEITAMLNEGVSTIRIGVLLMQNQLFLLGCPIDTKDLIATRINALMYESIQKVFGLLNKDGILAIIAFKQILEILRSTHALLLDFGLPIMPFDDTLSIVLSTDTPNSLQSSFLLSISDHLQNYVLDDYYLLINPYRLIPRNYRKVDIKKIFKSNAGNLMQLILEPTTSFISTESFRELFWMLDDGAITILHNQLLLSIDDIFDDFIQLFSAVQSRLQRIKNSPIASSCSEVFDRFEGAYMHFIDDSDILKLFSVMSQLGNIFAISEMMDNAYALKRSSTDQITSFLFCKSPENPNAQSPELFALFDGQLKEQEKYFSSYKSTPTESEVIQPFLHKMLTQFSSFMYKNQNKFAETSTNLLDLTSLKGFAATWSILEFLFILRESIHKTNDNNNYQSFGDGVQLCAAAVLCYTDQVSLYRLLSIGSRIKSHSLTDFNTNKDSREKFFIAANDKFSSTLQYAISSYKPILDHINSR